MRLLRRDFIAGRFRTIFANVDSNFWGWVWAREAGIKRRVGNKANDF